MTVPATLAGCSRCCRQSWRSLVRGLGADGPGEGAGCSHTLHQIDSCREVSHLLLIHPLVKWRGDSQVRHRASPSGSQGTQQREDGGVSSTHYRCPAPFKDKLFSGSQTRAVTYPCLLLWPMNVARLGITTGLNLGHKISEYCNTNLGFLHWLSVPDLSTISKGKSCVLRVNISTRRMLCSC